MNRKREIVRSVVHEYETTTRSCHDCGASMQGRRQAYHYEECGLSSVKLLNVLVYHCEKCGLRAPELPNITLLHLLIALDILSKDTLLAGEEIRFLRKMSALTQADLAEIMGVDRTRPSKWENDNPPIGKENDRLLRTFSLLGMAQQLIVGNDVDTMRALAASKAIRSVDVQKLLSSIQEKSEGPKEVKVENDPSAGQLGWYLSGFGPCLSGATQ